jgi:hypothetical protein
MTSKGHNAKVSLIVTVCGIALFGLLFLTAGLDGVRAQIAPSASQANGAAALYQGAVITSDIPVWDSIPGATVSRTVYFNNGANGGQLTTTFSISGTLPLTLTTGVAFGSPSELMTTTLSTTVSPWTPAVIYTVTTEAGSSTVLYTATTTNSMATVAITYERDIVGPDIWDPSIVVITGQPAEHCIDGAALYFSTDRSSILRFGLEGYAQDEGSGIDRVAFTAALGEAPDDVTYVSPWLSSYYDILVGEDPSGVLTATVYDRVGNTAFQTYIYEPDDTGPYTGSILIENGQPYVAQTEVGLSLSAEDAGCGVAEMCISNGPTCPSASWEPYSTTSSWSLTEGDGEKDVWVWYRDHLGNSSAAFSDTVILDTDPPVVEVTAPAFTSSETFSVTWKVTYVSPAGQEVVSYSVSYNEDGGAWDTWIPSTTLTQATFVSATVGHTYVFSVTAYDRMGNAGEGAAETVVDYFSVYLPLSIKNWASWYEYDIYEPNDSPDLAWGPLVSGEAYDAYIWNSTDSNDYYFFTPSTTDEVQADLTHIPTGCDFDLYIYHYSAAQDQYILDAYSNFTGGGDERVTFTPVAGRKYYVRVYPFQGFSDQEAYRLVADYH